jgi:Protein of unknown function (DUF3987)
LLRILKTPLPLKKGKTNELAPRALQLSMEARKSWSTFVGHVERQIGPGGELEPIKGLANKLPEHAARLAAVITLVGNIHAANIDEYAMKSGITLAEYYAAEALRVFEASKINIDLILAQRLLDWLHRDWRAEKGHLVSLPDIYRCGPGAIRDKATAKKMAGILADHGWLIPQAGGAEVDGKYRREVWRIVEGM